MADSFHFGFHFSRFNGSFPPAQFPFPTLITFSTVSVFCCCFFFLEIVLMDWMLRSDLCWVSWKVLAVAAASPGGVSPRSGCEPHLPIWWITNELVNLFCLQLDIHSEWRRSEMFKTLKMPEWSPRHQHLRLQEMSPFWQRLAVPSITDQNIKIEQFQPACYTSKWFKLRAKLQQPHCNGKKLIKFRHQEVWRTSPVLSTSAHFIL